MRGLGLVAEASHPQPQHPGGVHPGRARASSAASSPGRGWARRPARWPRPRAGDRRASSASGRAGARSPAGGRSPRAGRGGRGGRARPRSRRRARASGLDLVEEEAAALVPEPVDDRRGDRRLAGRHPRQAPEHVGHHLADHGPAAVADPARVPAQAPVAGDQQRKAVAAVLSRPRSGRTSATSRAPTRPAGPATATRRPRGRGSRAATRGGWRSAARPPGRRPRAARPRRAAAAGSCRSSRRGAR